MNLFKLVYSNSLTEKLLCFRELVEKIKILHDNHIVHRDIKSSNYLY